MKRKHSSWSSLSAANSALTRVVVLVLLVPLQNVADKDVEVLLQEDFGDFGAKDDFEDAQGLAARLKLRVEQELENGPQEVGAVVEEDVEQLLPALPRHQLLAVRVALVEVALLVGLELLRAAVLGKFLDDDHDALDAVVVLEVHLFGAVHKKL